MGLPGTGEWRRDRDSNPGRLLHLAGFQDQRIALPSLRQQLLGYVYKCIHLAGKTASIIYYLRKECCPITNLLSEAPQCGACCFYLGLVVFPARCSPLLRKRKAKVPKMSYLIARCLPYLGVTRTKGASRVK